jgi:hypothetical protein
MSQSPARARDVTLVDLVDQLLGTGVAVAGDVTIGVAGVDLIYLGLRTLLASVGTLERLERPAIEGAKAALGNGSSSRPPDSASADGDASRGRWPHNEQPPPSEGAGAGLEALERISRALERGSFLPSRVDADPEDVERGLARLVLTVVELLRQLMERQAMRRVEAGTLTDEQVERMGETFLRLSTRMEELKRAFGLEGEDLTITLGPLGDLL